MPLCRYHAGLFYIMLIVVWSNLFPNPGPLLSHWR